MKNTQQDDVSSSAGSSVDEDVFAGNDWSPESLHSSTTTTKPQQQQNQRHSKQNAKTTDSSLSSKSRKVTRTHSQLRNLVVKLLSPVLRSSNATQSYPAGPDRPLKRTVKETQQPLEKKDKNRRPCSGDSAPRRSAPPQSRQLALAEEKKQSRRDLTAKQQHKSIGRLSISNTPHPEENVDTKRKSIANGTSEGKNTGRPRTSFVTQASVKRMGTVPALKTVSKKDVPRSDEMMKQFKQSPKQTSRRIEQGLAAATSIRRSPSPNKKQASDRRLTFAKTPSRRTIKEGQHEPGQSRRKLVEGSAARSERNLIRTMPSAAQIPTPPITDTVDNRAIRKGLDERTSIANKSRKELIQMASQRRFSSSGTEDVSPREPSRRALTKSPIAKDRGARKAVPSVSDKQPDIEWKPEIEESSGQTGSPARSNELKIVQGSVVSPDSPPRQAQRVSMRTIGASSLSLRQIPQIIEESLSSASRSKSKKDLSRRVLLSSTGKSEASFKSQRSVTKKGKDSNQVARRDVAQPPRGALKRTDPVKKESTPKLLRTEGTAMSRSSSKKNVTNRTARRRSIDLKTKSPRRRSVSPTEPTESSDFDYSQTKNIPLYRLTYKNDIFRSERVLEKEYELDPILNKVK
ncbi:hypothetical protein FisN_6Lh451 [Fistulifera solaris]|uniref:Uncharacterized protein n=1 Tax=Fistulifera solaris TaxID=1519565 RepID=A0A1Z5JTQ3_FISSO|nr:hypothetical protein FisN_6Lh451 [Fistulifera solaris]|eukprot:GAX17151.1 hypothetical protein FisN_6Lh451 [Fistulifera solaris]